jgi:hypothetical protein
MCRIVSILLCSLFALLPGLFGCAAKSDPPPQIPPSPVEAYMISAGFGDSARLDDPAFGRDVNVVMENGFTSAKGEECHRATILAGEKEAEVVVVCKNAAGEWKMAPRVWGQGIERP